MRRPRPSAMSLTLWSQCKEARLEQNEEDDSPHTDSASNRCSYTGLSE
jgi:hypothetical protein